MDDDSGTNVHILTSMAPNSVSKITNCLVSPETDFPSSKRIKLESLASLEDRNGSFTEETTLGVPSGDVKVFSNMVGNSSSNSESELYKFEDENVDIKPDISNLSSDTFYIEQIKTEPGIYESDFSIDTEVTVKNEPCENIEEDWLTEEILNQPSNITEKPNKIEPTEAFLSRNQEIFTKFCGLPDVKMFCLLLNYIQDDMPDIKGATKYEQLFSVLAKVHKNEDNLYLDKFVFPATYVNTIELLYQKLGFLCRPISSVGIPEVFVPDFDVSQKVIIIGILSLAIRNTPPNFTTGSNYVKYLIGYTAFGDVFFVSKQFSARSSIQKMLYCSKIHEKLQKDYWILFNEGANMFVVQVEKLSRNKPLPKVELYSNSIKSYSLQVIERLRLQFRVFQSRIPDFMVYKDNTSVCFLDQLVFVCCMILNMLPRCAY